MTWRKGEPELQAEVAAVASGSMTNATTAMCHLMAFNSLPTSFQPVIDRTAGFEDKLKTLDLSISKFQTSVEYITQQLGRRLESIENKLARIEATTDVQRIAKQVA